MSSCARPGYSASNSASAMPDASRSRISETQMRVPLMQGFPPHIPGSIEIRCSCGFIVHLGSMSLLYRKSYGCELISENGSSMWTAAMHSFNLKNEQKFDPKKHVERALGR